MPEPALTQAATWVQLEGQPHDATMATGLTAAVHDPLWLLARQLQTGELDGEDTGSPWSVTLDATSTPLTRYRPDAPGAEAAPYDPLRQPLEPLVEADPVPTGPHAGSAIDIRWNAATGELEPDPPALLGSLVMPPWTAFESVTANDVAGADLTTDPLVLPRTWEDPTDPFRPGSYVPLFGVRTRNGNLAKLLVVATRRSCTLRWTTWTMRDSNPLVVAAGQHSLPHGTGLALDIPQDPARLAAVAGGYFLACLNAARVDGYAANYLNAYPLPAPPADDAASVRFAAVVGDSVPDGFTLYQTLTEPPRTPPYDVRFPPLAGVEPRDQAALIRASDAFAAWMTTIVGDVSPAGSTCAPTWRPDRLEYQFSVAAKAPDAVPETEHAFIVREYDNGRLDWDAFHWDRDCTLGAAADTPARVTTHRVGLPSPARYPGMPVDRFWEFEDAAVDFGSITTASHELATVLLVGYAVEYGNDHFVIPLDLPVGSVTHVAGLQVLDTFSDVTGATEVRHISDADPAPPEGERPSRRFRLFEPSVGSDRCRLILVPPVTADTLDSPPIENVELAYDEAANVGWAIEHRAARPGGFPTARETAETRPGDNAAVSGSAWRYRLRTPIADNWYPLLALPDAPGKHHLELGVVTPLTASRPPPTPWGTLLAELARVPVPEEELTRSRTLLQRTWQTCRWHDGRHHSWVGRSRIPATGAAHSSGLRYDAIEITGRSD